MLELYAEQIARRVQSGSVLVELGSGYVRLEVRKATIGCVADALLTNLEIFEK